MVDVAIVGGGPAGFSAAINVRARGASCVIVSNDIASNPLARSSRVDNYPGMRGVSGLKMLETMRDEAKEAGAEIRRGHVLSIAKYGEEFMLAVGSDIVQAKTVILATGVRSPKKLNGEDALLGRGVSYCATCDGMLYRGKRVAVCGDAEDLAEEAALLKRIGVDVTVVGDKRPPHLAEDIPFIAAKPTAVTADSPVALVAGEETMPFDGVFILRNEQAIDQLMPDLQTDGRFVKINARCETNVAGLFAAGDCTGKPLQVATAVAEGLIAAWSATEYIK
ncbi:MAG: FAD-dependent oxidoreductase [Clostridia bacterium]|nr:FAD-dependent oxidoreductase [Clostridia bacterium]